MSKHSDHKKPQFDINQYLPEVFKSDVNTSVFDMAFNRHLTKDDTQRVAGVIGESSPTALVKRQIQETSPHRQAYQLAPTMYSKVGTVETSLSYKAFLRQLELMGVSMERMEKWGDTLQFNWVPPVNIDMLVNYQDYFWSPQTPGQTANYFTVENRCNKSKSKLASYNNIVSLRGETFSVVRINFAANQFVISSKLDDLFVPGFLFFTTNATNPNVSEKFWTVDASSYDDDTRETTITVVEPIATIAAVAPTAEFVGQWWYNTAATSLRQWTGTAWGAATQAVAVTISLAELREVYQTETNCACAGDLGWDIGLWDDNQTGSALWAANLFSTFDPDADKRIDFETSDEWLLWQEANPQNPVVQVGGVPVNNTLWYDTTTDQLKQWSSFDGANPSNVDWVPKWITVVSNFSALQSKITGNSLWDLTTGCDSQALNQWSSSNRWVHKTEVRSFAGVKRAQLPIFEYSSNLELNEWARVERKWKYRTEADRTFIATDAAPHRIELEPIKGYTVVYDDAWYIYLFDKTVHTGRNVDYTQTFKKGYQFRVVDDNIVSDVYTVDSSEYFEITSDEPSQVVAITGTGVMCTVIRLEEPAFNSSIRGGTNNNARIEPLVTSTGDAWRGYHLHWLLDVTDVTMKPIANSSLNLFRKRDLTAEATVELVAGNTAYEAISFQPALTSTIELGNGYQEIRLSIPNVKRIDLASKFRFDGTASNVFATPNSNDLRVYVNGVRQYNTYEELTAFGDPDYTMVGRAVITTIDVPYVTGIVFDKALKALDVVRIEIGAASFTDMGLEAVPVRTIDNEAAFALAMADGEQPVYVSLSQNVLMEQNKASANQYPLFNVYDVITGEVVKSSPILSFKEDADYGINSVLQRRIVISDDGRDFDFEQHLLDRDDNILYGYRDTSINVSYWYNPLARELKHWDGNGWTFSAPFSIDDATYYRRAVVSDTEPTLLLDVDYALWYDTVQDLLFVRDADEGEWNSIGVVISISDPTLRTVWRRGANNESAVPTYVDSERNEVAIGTTGADWGIVDQWMYNPQHKNKQVVKYSQVLTHFNSIIKSQPLLPGLQGGGVYTLTQAAYNYGIGGTIKEHNDSFDTLVSAVNVTNVTPLGVIEYAANEYASHLLQIRSLFTKVVPTLLTDYSYQSIVDLDSFVVSRVIARYEDNDARAQVFGDTSAFDPETLAGVRNWISTSPMFGLSQSFRPHLNKSGNFVELFHHDGHRTVVSYATAELDKMCRLVCNTTDNRTDTSFGKVSTSSPPSTVSLMETNFGEMRRGLYWYHVNGSTRKLYRFEMLSFGNIPPALTLNGEEIADGVHYYNTSNNTTYRKAGFIWTPVTNPGDANVLPMWREIDLSLLLGEMLLEVENRLYDVTPVEDLVFDYDTLVADSEDQVVLDDLNEERFLAYARNQEIKAPLINVGYDASDAFTWNYTDSILVTPPRTDISPGTAGCWQQMYTQWFGTPYPHLEPWKLQGFRDKPTWWDSEYLDPTNIRRWNYSHSETLGSSAGMWEEIRLGRVPVGELLADGVTVSTGANGQAPLYNYFCVNINNSPLAGAAPDSLLPPYFLGASSTDTTLRSMFTLYSTQIVAPDADLVFGDGGLVEWQWKTSLQYSYDQSMIAFMMQPVRFIHAAFGPRFAVVDGLQVETLFKQVYSHQDTLFHGDVYNVDQSYSVRGLNQWYVNYNRSSSYDTNGEFRHLWSTWTPHQTYQFGGIIDTSTFEISNKNIDVVESDYNVILVNNGVFKDTWLDAFEVSLLHIPPPLIQYNNQSAWKMELDTLSSLSRPISYYGVKEYSQLPDPVIRQPLDIIDVTVDNEFVIEGNVLSSFPPGTEFDVDGSTTGDDGTYTVIQSHFDSVNAQTVVSVEEQIPSA